MPKIEIREYDLTSPGRVIQNNEVVYIPGLVDTECVNLTDKDSNYIGIKPFTPTLFTNVTDFINKVGQHGYIFEEDQYYSDIVIGQFNEADIPYHNTMFTKDSVDPSYVIAKELLAAGLHIVYERINPEKSLDALNSKPLNWPEGTYYKKADKAYKKLPHRVNYFIQNPAGVEHDSTKSYYTLEVTDEFNRYVPTTDTTKITYSPVGFANGEFTNPCYQMSEALIIDTDNWTNGKTKNTSDIYTYNNSVYTVGEPESNEPTGWSNDYMNYYEYSDGQFKLVSGVMNGENLEAPAFTSGKYYTSNAFSEITVTYDSKEKTYNPTFDYNKYYTFDSINNEYNLITEPWNALKSNFEGEGTLIFNGDVYIPYNGEVGEDGKSYIAVKYPRLDADNSYVLPSTYMHEYHEFTYEADDIMLPYIYNKDDTINFTELYVENNHCDINSIYNNLPYVYSIDRENSLDDKGNINIKYITSGGYPTYGYNGGSIANAMLDFAQHRNDCYALIDITDNQDRSQDIQNSNNIYNRLLADTSFRSTYGAMFIPHMEYVRTTTDKDDDGKVVPGAPLRLAASYAYLKALADSITVNPAWLAVAGASRGLVQNLASDSTSPITNKNADSMQPRNTVAINCITNIKPYGNVIWGNRTLSNNEDGNLTALSMLNIRNLVCDVKKICYTTAKFLTFEQNNEILWLNFKSRICPTLDQMLSGYGISKYKIERDYTREEALEKATICVRITLYPVYAVEDFYIDIILSDDEVTTEE